MSRGKELIKNTGILMLAKISTQVVSFVLLPLYTAILSTEEYGRIDIYTSLTMIIIPFVTLQIEMALFRYYIVEKEWQNRIQIISSSIAVVIGMTILMSGLYWTINAIKPFQYANYLYFYYLTMLINTVLLQVCRAQGDNIAYGAATFMSSAFTVGLNVVFVALFHLGVTGMLLSSILAHLISALYMVVKTRVCTYISVGSVKIAECRKLLEYSVPLIFNQVASWAINYSDRLIILYFLGERFNGIYSVACKFSNITSTFFGVYNVAWTENVIRSMNDDDGERYISKVFELTFAVYIALVTAIINVLPFFYGLLVNEKFAESYEHVPILLIGMMFSGLAATIGSIYIAFNKTKEVSITTMLAGVTNIVVHLALLKFCGLFAASISTLVSFGALFIYRLLFINNFFKLRFHVQEYIVQLLILVLAWFAYGTKNWLLIVIGLVLNLLYIYSLLRKNRQALSNLLLKHKRS